MVVAGRVKTVCHQHFVVLQFLGLICDDIPFTLLGNYMTNETALRLDVIGDFIRFVTILAVFENRLTFPLVVQTVPYSFRVYLARIQVHTDILGVQLHRLVFQFALSVQVRISVSHYDHRVVRLVVHRRCQLALVWLRFSAFACRGYHRTVPGM